MGSLDPETGHNDDADMLHSDGPPNPYGDSYGLGFELYDDDNPYGEPDTSHDAEPAMSQDAEPAMSHDAEEFSVADEIRRRLNSGIRDKSALDRWFQGTPPVSAGAVARLGDLSTLPVTIYLSDGEDHEQVEAAVGSWLAAAGLMIVSRDDPVLGSWFRRMQATFNSPAARESARMAAHIADNHLYLAQDAAVTAKLMQGVAPVLDSLRPYKDAVVRLQAVLIVRLST